MEIIIRDEYGRITEYHRSVIRELIEQALGHVAEGKIVDFNIVCDMVERRCQTADAEI